MLKLVQKNPQLVAGPHWKWVASMKKMNTKSSNLVGSYANMPIGNDKSQMANVKYLSRSAFDAELKRIFSGREFVMASWIGKKIEVSCFPPGSDDIGKLNMIKKSLSHYSHRDFSCRTILVEGIRGMK